MWAGMWAGIWASGQAGGRACGRLGRRVGGREDLSRVNCVWFFLLDPVDIRVLVAKL